MLTSKFTVTLPDAYFCDPRDAYCCNFFLPFARVSSFSYSKAPVMNSVINCISSHQIRNTVVAIGAYKAFGGSLES